ncbi:NAD(+) diphosphatase [Geoalkalibacter subterraneus]|jgi:NAD+ diphosphatase|uniref:NAD(+) diphosphatase n=1 Tax=Geoalkalibacter subterraneus TaxID=483547 RepID=UPI0006935E48|nr:NAD(+) diphosphatase [Geoalkalibacter subterraneus]
MTPLPDFFESPLHLPFNSTSMDGFTLLPPDLEPPGTDGWWLALRSNALLLSEKGSIIDLPYGPCPADTSDSKSIFIGTWQGRPVRVMAMNQEEDVPSGFVLESLLSANPRMQPAHLSLGGLASQLLHWEANSCFCSRCGAALQRLPGEWGKKCEGCHYLHFPHIHPCVIVAVRRPGEILLTRKREWAPNRYSLVAGFLDPGECLEEAVAREVQEETGLRVKNIRYVGSQCWPFPSQVMTGFTADYAGGEVVVEEKELEDARWFPINALPDLPPKRSIARYLIDGAGAEAGTRDAGRGSRKP